MNYRVWGIPAVLSRKIPGNALRAFPGSFRNFFRSFFRKVPAVLGVWPIVAIACQVFFALWIPELELVNQNCNFNNSKILSELPCVTKWLPAGLKYFGTNYRITVTDSLQTLIVWELITDYRYRLRNSRTTLSQLIVVLPSPTLIFVSELITVRVTVADTDFNFWS